MHILVQPLFFVYTQNAYKKGRVRKWGDIDITENMSYNSSVAKLNPFRYRGYYYDAETGLYYLNSRYYDPSIGRFINADDISYIQPTDINGLNLFAYCGNNPVMYTDPEGTWSWSSFWRGVVNVLTGVGAIVAGALVIASGVAGVGMLVVAGVTITAGALTTINGGADIGEAISGYNFVRDGIFGGNQSAYNLYSGITAGVAAVGSAICGGWLRYNAPRINAYKNIEAYQYSNTLIDSEHMARSYQHSVLLQKQIIKYGKMVKESKQIVNFTIKGGFRIGKGVWHDATWKLVVNYIKGIIFHIGPF
ncbi:RHS repeat-associated core domain-containing protein [Barnesiella intestinihominis]|uniref:RHS repeat-associated core domain-containing protein n=1 Tax=Barnesiella intestinihominis TaxID=487174 RepID=UPI0039A2B8AB